MPKHCNPENNLKIFGQKFVKKCFTAVVRVSWVCWSVRTCGTYRERELDRDIGEGAKRKECAQVDGVVGRSIKTGIERRREFSTMALLYYYITAVVVVVVAIVGGWCRIYLLILSRYPRRRADVSVVECRPSSPPRHPPPALLELITKLPFIRIGIASQVVPLQRDSAVRLPPRRAHRKLNIPAISFFQVSQPTHFFCHAQLLKN